MIYQLDRYDDRDFVEEIFRNIADAPDFVEIHKKFISCNDGRHIPCIVAEMPCDYTYSIICDECKSSEYSTIELHIQQGDVVAASYATKAKDCTSEMLSSLEKIKKIVEEKERAKQIKSHKEFDKAFSIFKQSVIDSFKELSH